MTRRIALMLWLLPAACWDSSVPRIEDAADAAPAAPMVASDPFAASAPATSVVSLPTSCVGLPRALRVSPASTLGESVSARWAASTSGSGASRDCTLEVLERREHLKGRRVPVFVATLSCGTATVSDEVGTGVKRSPVDVLSERLVWGLAGRLCANP